MAQKIESTGPGKIKISFVCDFPPHSTGGWGRSEIFTDTTDYMATMKIAAAHGWRRIADGSWRGPCCPKS